MLSPAALVSNKSTLGRHQQGMTSMLVVAGVVALLMFLSVSDSGVLSLKKESVKNGWDISKAQMNANEGLNQLRAYFNSLNHNELSSIQGQFRLPVSGVCDHSQNGPVGEALPIAFRPTIAADRVTNGDQIEIYATISHREDYCLTPEPRNWKLNYRIIGSYQCAIQGDGACAKHELFGSMIPSENYVDTSCTQGANEVCENVEIPGADDRTETTYKTCGQQDAYEFKPLNLRSVGGFTMGEVYSRAVAANPNRIRDMSKMWKAPITVTGNVINGTRSAQMQAEGLETNLAVSFSENALFLGTHNLPPLPYYKPLEIGGQVIARDSAPAANGQTATTGVGLKVLGVHPTGGSGELTASAVGPVAVNYSYLNHPSNPGRDLNPDLLSPVLLQQTAGFSSSLAGNSAYTNTSYLRGLQGDTDRLLKHFLGLDLNDLQRVSREGTNSNLTSMLPIENAQRNSHGLFTSGSSTSDEKDWRKVGVVYYYVDVRSQPKTTLNYQQQGQTVNKSPVFSSGQGGTQSELNAQPAQEFCEDNPIKVPNGNSPATVNFEDLVNQYYLSNNNRTSAMNNQGNREPSLGCEVALEKQNPGLWQRIKDQHSILSTARFNADNTRNSDVQAADRDSQPRIAEKNQEIDRLQRDKDAALRRDDEAEAIRIQREMDRKIAERDTLVHEYNSLVYQADSKKNASYQTALQNWNDSLSQMQARNGYQSALNSGDHKKNKTIRVLVENRRWGNFVDYRSNSTPRWIRDHWNNPVNTSGGCLSWDTTAHFAPCRPPFSGAQSIHDNAVVVVDVRGTDGLYWRHLEYPAAQLIIVLGNLYVEDVILNSNIVVAGDLVVMNPGFAVAPRRWWGIPRYKKCSANLSSDSAPLITDSRRESTTKKMGGLFYFYTDRTDQARSCVVTKRINGGPSRTETVCRKVQSEFCEVETRTTKSRLEPSIRFFER